MNEEEEEAPLEDPRVRQIAMLCTKKPSFEIACISYVHDVQLFKTECYLRNQYGLKKLGDFTMSEGHRYSLVDIIHNIIVLGTTRTIISCEHSLWHGLVQLLVVNTVCGMDSYNY